ncbi:MAG: hypothetical protein M0P77_04950 [Firmicutes bacterium]|nr:hypothetical protein [Bacillota bacterium]
MAPRDIGLLIEDGESLRPAIPGGPDGAEAWSVWENEKETMNFEIVKDGKYKYYIYDEYGMVCSRDIEINYIDSEKPEVTFSDEKFENGALKFTATVTDDYPLDGGYLLVKFGGDFIKGSHLKDLDKVYGDDSEYTDVYISIPLNRESISKGAYRKAGIYNLTIEDADDGKEKIVKIEMVIGNVTEYSDSDVYLDAVDSVGNDIYVSRPFYYPQEKYCVYHFYEEYEYAPAIIDAEWNSGESIVYLNFNTPVKLLSNGLSNSDYGSSVPTTISVNGTYTIEYADTFGDTYREFIEIDLPALELGLDIQYNTAPTNQNITLTVKALGDGVNITAVKIGDNAEENLSPAEQEYVMTIEENCIVYVTIKKSGVDPRTQAISIDNIDKTEITAELIWRYEGNVDEDSKTTTASVNVTVVGNKPLLGDLTYTFTNDAKKDDKHIFNYRDEAGNTGNITATLGYNVVFPTNYEDKLAPGVDIKVYFKTFEAYNQGLSGSAGNFNLSNINDEPPEGLGINPPDYSKDIGSSIDWNGEDDVSIRSQAVRMDLKITDQSETKVFIKSSNNPPKYNGASDNIDKVRVEGNSIFIETNINEDITPKAFYIFVVDEKNNWTSFLVKPGLLDKTAPEIEDISVKLHDSFRAEAILKIAQKDADYTTVTNRTGIIKYDDNTYGYMTGSNETVTFYYHDSVGNSDEKSIKAEGLDTYAPELIKLIWLPQGTGTGDIQNPPTELMKGSLLAQLTIKNQFSKIELINDEDKDVKLSFTDRKINLIFNENAEVELEITSPNNNTLVYSLIVSCLDNRKLEIDCTKMDVAKNKRSAKFSFTPNKDDVYFVEGKQYRNEGEPFDEYTVISTKPVELNFTDKVGNVYKEKIDLSGVLDFSPLKLKFNTIDDDEGEKDKLSQLDDKLNFTGDTLEIYVKSSHKVKVEGAVEKKIDSVSTWTKLTANRVGDRATLKFTDDRGDTFSTAAYYKAPDNVPPVILLKETVISISKDIATKQILEDLIKESIMVSDNVSKDDNITVTIDTSKVKFKELGLYAATIKAKDKAGNESFKDIQIRIAPAEGLLVQIGNRFLEPNGSHILYGKNLSFNLLKQSREDAEEPYKIYVKKELQTPGQMKSAKIYFYNDDEKDKQEIVFTSAGMHTVYIQTQNRYAYTFYVYVMD